MDIMFSRIFIGVFILLIGISIILNGVFKINIPLFRILIAVLIIYFGVRMLIGGFYHKNHSKKENVTAFSENRVVADSISESKKYSVVFGNQKLDLSAINTQEGNKEVETNCVFGSQHIVIDSSQNVKINVNSAFASAKLPDGNSIAMGEYTYKSANYSPASNTLYVKANVVFGSLLITVK